MPRILIAEDEPDIRDLIAFTLQFGGFEVVVTTNGQEAVERAAEAAPDLILLDVRMPRMTGYEACAALKDNPKTAHIPVVFLSAKGQEGEVKSGMDVGALDYILKPFAPDELINRVRELTAKPAPAPAKPADKPAAPVGPADKPAAEPAAPVASKKAPARKKPAPKASPPAPAAPPKAASTQKTP